MPDWLTARPVAHRGLHDAAAGVIENTTTAFTAAISAAYAIECDVQISADGDAMVHHDDTLDRLTDSSGRLDRKSAADLRRVAFKGTANRMMTLGELCDLVAGRVTLVVELKSRFDGDLRLANKVAQVLTGYRGPVAAMSFDPAPMGVLRDLIPNLTRGLVAQRRNDGADNEHGGGSLSAGRFVLQAVAARLDFLAYRVRDLTGPIPLTARHVLGLPLLTWTVRTEAERQRAERYADQIIFEGFRP